MSISYEERIKIQNNQYNRYSDIHTNNPAAQFLRENIVKPAFLEYFDAPNHVVAYTKLLIKLAQRRNRKCLRIASIGSGTCDLEAQIVETLLKMGFEKVIFICFDISPKLLTEGRRLLKSRGISEKFDLRQCDLNKAFPEEAFDIAIAHHSLHHLINLEGLFESVEQYLADDGAFMSCDVIGRNGHLRWPEAAAVIDAFWEKLPERLRYDHIFKRIDKQYIDFDCSNKSFEGIRSQAILPNLLKFFKPEVFFGYGGISDPFVSKRFGPNFDLSRELDEHILSTLISLNIKLNNIYWVKPTRMIAVFRKKKWEGNFIGNLNPAHCVHDLWLYH